MISSLSWSGDVRGEIHNENRTHDRLLASRGIQSARVRRLKCTTRSTGLLEFFSVFFFFLLFYKNVHICQTSWFNFSKYSFPSRGFTHLYTKRGRDQEMGAGDRKHLERSRRWGNSGTQLGISKLQSDFDFCWNFAQACYIQHPWHIEHCLSPFIFCQTLVFIPFHSTVTTLSEKLDKCGPQDFYPFENSCKHLFALRNETKSKLLLFKQKQKVLDCCCPAVNRIGPFESKRVNRTIHFAFQFSILRTNKTKWNLTEVRKHATSSMFYFLCPSLPKKQGCVWKNRNGTCGKDETNVTFS